MRYLGVTLHDHLSWLPHVREVTTWALENINKNDKNRPQIFTDGSIAGEKTGIGIYIKNKQHQHYYSYNLKNTTSITTTELIGIEKALQIAEHAI